MANHHNLQRSEQAVDVKEFVSLVGELDQLREEQSIPYRKNAFEKLGEWYLDHQKANSAKTTVNQKIYCRLCLLGPFGVHHFYAKHWAKGVLYLLFCWTGVPVAMAVVDWMIAVPQKADANGMIEI